MMDEGFPNFDIGDVESLFASSGHNFVSLFCYYRQYYHIILGYIPVELGKK